MSKEFDSVDEARKAQFVFPPHLKIFISKAEIVRIGNGYRLFMRCTVEECKELEQSIQTGSSGMKIIFEGYE